MSDYLELLVDDPVPGGWGNVREVLDLTRRGEVAVAAALVIAIVLALAVAGAIEAGGAW